MTTFFGIEVIQESVTLMVVTLAISISVVSGLIHRRMVNRDEMERIREQIGEHQKRYVEAKKSGDEKKLKKLENEQTEILKLVKQNMLNSMKPTFVIMLLVIPIFWYLNSTYNNVGPVVRLPVSLPLLTYCISAEGGGECVNRTVYHNEAGTIELGGSGFVGWIGLYICLGIMTVILMEIITRKVLKKKKK